MANSKNDDMDRSGNRNTSKGSTTQGNQGDPINLDRAMNRDGKLGQGSSGTDESMGSAVTPGGMGSGSSNSELYRNRNTSGSDSSRSGGRGSNDTE